MSAIERWVGDKLHDVLGISEKYIAQFMVGLAQKSGSPADLIERIKATDTIDVNEKVVSFAQELWNKVQRNMTSNLCPVHSTWVSMKWVNFSRNSKKIKVCCIPVS